MSTPTQASAVDPLVQRAIEIRTEALANRAKGVGSNLSEVNYYYNSKTPWIRMTSSANVDGSSALAQKYILGTLVDDDGKSPLTPSGMEVSSTLGLRPRPHITSMSCFHHGRYGALRDITVEFECFSRDQLDDLEKLFMRPGVSVLVEWGHSLYLKEVGNNLEVRPMGPKYGGMFDGKSKTLLKLNEDLHLLRSKYGYDYDAGFGIIKNFEWTFTGAGPSYKCKVVLSSPGEALGSLKTTLPLPDNLAILYKLGSKEQEYIESMLNSSGSNANTSTSSNPSETDSIPNISLLERMPLLGSSEEPDVSSVIRTFVSEDLIKYFHKNVLEAVRKNAASSYTNVNYEKKDGSLNSLQIDSTPRISKVNYTQYTSLQQSLTQNYSYAPGAGPTPNDPWAAAITGRSLSNIRGQVPHITKDLGVDIPMLTLFFKEVIELDTALLEDSEIRSNLQEGRIEFWERWRTFSYIRYGDFLEVLNKLMLFSNNQPLFQFDTTSTQKFRKPALVQSIDPGVCLLPGDVIQLAPKVTGFKEGSDLVSIADIALNITNLYDTLQRVNGSYADLLEDLNTQIGACTGNIVELDVHYFERQAMFAVVDRTRQKGQKSPQELPLLGTHSMARDFSINTTITNKLASSIATSVSSGGAREDLERTLLNFHSGRVTDRNLPSIDTYPENLLTKTPGSQDGGITQESEDQSYVYQILAAIYTEGRYSEKLSRGGIGLLSHMIQEQTPKSELGGLILPYTLDVTLDGISGLQIMDAFTISSNLLPTAYNNDLTTGNLITGLNQSVNKGAWTVSIKSQYYNIKEHITDNKTPEWPALVSSNVTLGIGNWNTLYDVDGKTIIYTSEPQQYYNGPNSDIELENLKQWVLANANLSIGAQTVGALKAMVDSIGQGKGYKIILTSKFRTLAKQQELYDDYKAGKSNVQAAPPGKSMHNWGGAYDFNIINTNNGKVYNTITPVSEWNQLGITSAISPYGFIYGGNFQNADPIHISYTNNGSVIYDKWLDGSIMSVNGSAITDSTGSVMNPSIWNNKPELAVDLYFHNNNKGVVEPAYVPQTLAQQAMQYSNPQSSTYVPPNVNPNP